MICVAERKTIVDIGAKYQRQCSKVFKEKSLKAISLFSLKRWFIIITIYVISSLNWPLTNWKRREWERWWSWRFSTSMLVFLPLVVGREYEMTWVLDRLSWLRRYYVSASKWNIAKRNTCDLEGLVEREQCQNCMSYLFGPSKDFHLRYPIQSGVYTL